MDLCVRFLGLDLFSIHISTGTTETVEHDEPGDCLTTPMGFVATHEIPDMAGPYREGWE